MLPLSMLSPIIVYIGALTPLAIETYLPKDPECYTRPGHGHYRVAINTIFGIAWLQLLLEVLTFFAALIGKQEQDFHAPYYVTRFACKMPCHGNTHKACFNLCSFLRQVQLYALGSDNGQAWQESLFAICASVPKSVYYPFASGSIFQRMLPVFQICQRLNCNQQLHQI